ncbi:uncharacterized protein ACA1_165620 [Acanthamoeba castellanii str. Neff]|uniref:Uncharacterized protein n=1 Tax=Acanthamoeba castellanii (strain ATCC 30010 / Neff) TaxID=1257118 RepID=L8HIW6_ACACF|nr:uncharacterized protein ACA1_165620 [Acanthamoeba castellanii str. Neff]ELR24351.1 hypothetical protein ACA1_165620 [Acanthamoeba castellanii str. Neff]
MCVFAGAATLPLAPHFWLRTLATWCTSTMGHTQTNHLTSTFTATSPSGYCEPTI